MLLRVKQLPASTCGSALIVRSQSNNESPLTWCMYTPYGRYMPIYPTHEHRFLPIDEHGEECSACGYARWRGIPGSEYIAADA